MGVSHHHRTDAVVITSINDWLNMLKIRKLKSFQYFLKINKNEQSIYFDLHALELYYYYIYYIFINIRYLDNI